MAAEFKRKDVQKGIDFRKWKLGPIATKVDSPSCWMTKIYMYNWPQRHLMSHEQ
jgi:hypothetical protein